MTNPPAGITAEGSGGVINLISKTPSKHAAEPTTTGMLKATVGSGDRFDVGVSGAYTAQGLSLTAGAEFRRSAFSRGIASRYGIPDSTSGEVVPAEGEQDQGERDDTLLLNGGVGYDIDPHDHFDATVNAVTGRLIRNQTSAYQSSAETGPLALDYVAPGFYHGYFTSTSESLGLTHALPGDVQTVSIKLALSQNDVTFQNGAAYTYETPSQLKLYQNLIETAAFPQLDLKVDYNTILPNKAKVTIGYEGTFDWQNMNNRGVQGASADVAVADPAVAQRFTFYQEVHALYATYEQAFGKLTVQPSLRLESTTVDTNLLSSAEKGRQQYFEANPSLHLDYALDDASQFRASYGRRIQRPDETQLDPFRIEASTILYNSGNPDLRPAITQSYELGYEYRQKATDLQATLFYRDKSDLLTPYVQDIGGDVLLNTWTNIGDEHDVGLELVANHNLSRTISVTTSTDLMRTQVYAGNLGIADGRSAFVASGRATLNWQVSPNDFLQLGGQASGRQLTAQGYTGGSLFSNLGWRHRFDSRLSAVLTADNPFGLSRRTTVVDTPTLVDIEKRKYNNVALFFGLTYALGALPKLPDTFDFGSQGPAVP